MNLTEDYTFDRLEAEIKKLNVFPTIYFYNGVTAKGVREVKRYMSYLDKKEGEESIEVKYYYIDSFSSKKTIVYDATHKASISEIMKVENSREYVLVGIHNHLTNTKRLKKIELDKLDLEISNLELQNSDLFIKIDPEID